MRRRKVWRLLQSSLDSKLSLRRHSCQSRDFMSELKKSELIHTWSNCFGSHQSFLQNNVTCPVSEETTCRVVFDNILDLLLSPHNSSFIKCTSCIQNENELVIDYDIFGVSLYDIIRYSPGRLRNRSAMLFIIFQIIHSVKQLHEVNLPHGSITLHNVFVDDNSNALLGFPSTIDVLSNTKLEECHERENDVATTMSTCNNSKVREMTTDWILHKVSNYDYLMYLNKLSGRQKGDPSNSAILPWITNFETPNGGLRDLKKSKYRLCKGEDQLNANFKASLYNHVTSKRPSWTLGSCISEKGYDIMNHQQDFMKLCDELSTCNLNTPSGNLLHSITGEHITNDIGQHNVNITFSPHHLLDIMPDLTYYTYMARKTPLSLLTQFVRPVYQPQEFPTSIARLYESTPDECIPEFFTDPSVFSSIHPDMSDLGLPPWCSTAEEFIEYHGKLLESDEVSTNLHHWIDLNFGYKLLGSAALDAKNVHLELAGDQIATRSSGVICLFRTPHPQRICSKYLSTYFGAVLPDSVFKDMKASTSESFSINNNSDMKKMHSSGNKVYSENGNSTSTVKQIKTVANLKVNHTSKMSSVDGVSRNKIWLPDDYNPLEMINLYQNLCKFLSAETYIQDLNDVECIKLSKFNKHDNDFNNLFKIDLESLACLIVELSLYSLVNYTEANSWNHEERVNFARQQSRLHWDKIPNCLHDAVNAILRPFEYQNLVGEKFHKRFLPTVDIFLHILCEFPSYFFDLHYIREKLICVADPSHSFQSESTVTYIPKTDLYSAFFPTDNHLCLVNRTSNLSRVHIPVDIIKLLYPHIQTAVYSNPIWFLNILNSSKIVELFSSTGGKEFIQSHLLPLIVYLYKPEQLKRMSSDVSISIPLALLYSRRFLRHLLAYTSVNTFMVHILPYITLGLIGGSANALSDESTVWHQRSYTGGLTNETDYTNSSITTNNKSIEFNDNLNYNEEKVAASFNQPRSYALLSSSSSKKQTMLNVDEIGIDLRNLLTDEEFQFAEDTKGLTEFTCQSFNEEECDDITSHKSLTSGSNDEGVTRQYSPSTTSQTSKSSSQVLPDNSTEEKHANDIQKKVITPDVTSICTTNTTNSSSSSSNNCANISSIPPITAAMDSLNWLAKRIGPVMTNKYIIKYLLGTLTLCYEGKNQLSVNIASMPSSEKQHIMFPLQINNRPLIGDRSASSVLRCLEQFVQIYGVSFVLDIYLPFVVKTVNSIIACLSCGNNNNTNNNTTTTTNNNNSSSNSNNSTTDCSTDLTENLNQINISTLSVVWNYRTLARLIAALMLFYQIIMYLPDNELVEQLQESVLQDVLIKAVRISGRFDISFPGGVVGRRAVLYKFIDVVFVIGLRVGFELARTQLTSIFQVFFALFDRVINTTITKNILSNNNYQVKEDTSTTMTTTTTTATTNGIVDTKVNQVSSNDTNSLQTSSLNCIMTEMVETFDCDLARLAYISFCHLAGGTYIDDCLYNAQSIQKLINQSIFNESSSKSTNDTLNESCTSASKHSDCNTTTTTTTTTTTNSNNNNNYIKGVQTTRNKIDFETTLFVNSTLCNDSSFHLRGVWRQIVRDAIENKSFPSVPYKYHGIQIAAFTGHTSKINRITCLNTENCFITSSRDKTVQLWSLATTYNLGSHCLASLSSSSGNQKGNSVSSSSKNAPSVDSNSQQLIARLVYRAHKKSVIAAHYLEPHRLVASIDGNLLFWDPCTGQTVRSNSHSENSGWQNLTALECSAVPYGAVICSDHSAFVHLIDPRVKCSKQTGGLRFHSGASLASFLLSKERIKVETPPTNDSNKTSTNAQDIDLKLTPSYSRSTIDTSITKILHKLTEHLQPNLFHFNNSTSTTTTATTMMMMHMNMNSNSSTSLMSMNTNMAGVLNRLSMAKNGYYLLCGFTTGIITALDLRMGQVIDIWRGYHDAVVDIVPHKYNGFISCNDRSLSFIYPSANPININPNSLLNSYNQMNNAFNCLTYNSTIQFESEKIILPKLQNITCLTMCKENPIFCANSLSSSSYSSSSTSSSSSSTSRFPIFGGSSSTSNPSTNTVSEAINDNNPNSGLKVNELTGHPSVTPATHSSSISSQAYHHYGNNNNINNNNCNNNMNNSGGNDSIGGTILGTYLSSSSSSSSLSHTTTNNNNHNNFNPAYYYTIGRIPPNLLRGNISSILSLTENNFLLVGSDTGGLSALY